MNKDWKTYKFSELYEVSSGLSKSAKEFGFGFPFLSFSDVFWNYFIPNELDQLVNSSDSEQNTCSVKKGDVFLTRTSETVDELGMSCVALKDYPKATFNGFTKRLRPKSNKVIDPIFIGYYLRSPYFRGEITAYSTLTTRASLNNGIIEKLSVKLPNLLEQQKVSSVLFSYDQLIKNNTKRISILEQMAEQLYKEWFVRMRFPNYENNKFIKGIPEGWAIDTLDSVSKILRGKVITRETVEEGFVPVVAGGLSPAYYHNKSNTKSPTITISASGANAGFVNLYFEDIWASDCSFIDTRASSFLYFTYLTLKVRQKEIYHLQQGSAQPHVYPKDIKRVGLFLPPENLLKIFEELMIPIFEEIQNLKFQVQNLKKTRDLLLPKLISGKLKIE